jgi:hypothetical protein
MNYQSDRHFQLWDYTVGHAQVLLRSPASRDDPFNIDVVLVGVDKLEIPTRMQGLTIVGPEPTSSRPGDPTGVFRLTSGDKAYAIVAAACRVTRNQLDLMESSLEYFGPDQGGDPGEILCQSGTKPLAEPASSTHV